MLRRRFKNHGITESLSSRLERPELMYRLQYEVTNLEFKKFVDGDGYQKREYWESPFVKEGQEISWEQGMAGFRDATGIPGPSTWRLGTFPEGEADHPVRGVSWFEAAAYCLEKGRGATA